MRASSKEPKGFPSAEQLTAELEREKYKRNYRQVLRSTVYTLIVVAAAAVLVAMIWMPVLRTYGASMTPTLNEGDIVVSLKGADFQQGDLVAFYLGNKILVKRCIAGPGQWVDIDADGDRTVRSISSMTRTRDSNNNQTRYLRGDMGAVPHIGSVDMANIVQHLREDLR